MPGVRPRHGIDEQRQTLLDLALADQRQCPLAKPPARVAATRQRQARVGQGHAAHGIRLAQRRFQHHAAATGMAHQMGGATGHGIDKFQYVGGVLLNGKPLAFAVPGLGPIPTQAHGQHPERFAQRRHLRLPVAAVGQRPVHQHQRHAAAVLGVGHGVAANQGGLQG
ncbi:hypothetical protein D3C73_1062430 [compost metagenome]